MSITHNFSSVTSLNVFFEEVRQSVEKCLDDLIPRSNLAPERLHEAIRWSAMAGGKRIRPALLIATGRVFGAPPGSMIRTAAAVEMIHTYSLIHDDLPAMDDDDLRRGRATCHKQFDEATAILAGDVLQTLAFQAIAGDENLTPATRVRLISILAEASGTPAGMVAGQQLDLDAEGHDISGPELEQIHRLKTGALITAAAKAGAVIGGASDAELEAIEQYAAKLGLLFQITDDLLDVTQETGVLGKTAGKDVAAEKATYPGRYGIEAASSKAASVCDDARADLLPVDRDTQMLTAIAEFVLHRTR